MYVLALPDGRHAAWILPPKCATRSTEQALLATGVATMFAGRHGVHFERLALCDVAISNVRNPWDVLVSWWFYQLQGRPSGKTFHEYLEWAFEKPSHNRHIYWTPLQHAEYANELIRVEAGLQSQLTEKFKSLGLSAPTVEHVGAASDKSDFRDYYTTKIIELVRKQYGDKIDVYGYALGL